MGQGGTFTLSCNLGFCLCGRLLQREQTQNLRNVQEDECVECTLSRYGAWPLYNPNEWGMFSMDLCCYFPGELDGNDTRQI